MDKDSTRQAYETMLNEELSDDAYAEAQGNLAGFFGVLMEIDRDLKLSQKLHDL